MKKRSVFVFYLARFCFIAHSQGVLCFLLGSTKQVKLYRMFTTFSEGVRENDKISEIFNWQIKECTLSKCEVLSLPYLIVCILEWAISLVYTSWNGQEFCQIICAENVLTVLQTQWYNCTLLLWEQRFLGLFSFSPWIERLKYPSKAAANWQAN